MVMQATDPETTVSVLDLAAPPAIELDRVTRRFKDKVALDEVSMELRHGEIHALLGPNGAGKTTLLRILAGLADPDSGEVYFDGQVGNDSGRFGRGRFIGLIPSGERTFYMRISGLENLLFFARLHGLRRRYALRRSLECLEAVGLSEVGKLRVGQYSHGMQRRLAIARALLTDPPILLADEPTQGLDPHGARTVKELVREAAARGTAVMWTTQYVDEIRGFADTLTLLNKGTVRFQGSVPELMATTSARRYLLHLGGAADAFLTAHSVIVRVGSMSPNGAPGHYVLALHDGIVLGHALALLTGAGVDVLACREERSEVEEAFLNLTKERI
jgi:ABC-2 type transport system ATP-binding protein